MTGKIFYSLESRLLATAAAAFSFSAEKKKADSRLITSVEDCNEESVRSPDSVGIAIQRCTKMVQKKMTEIGIPGMVVGVSVNGRNAWTQGFGYADIENDVCCKAETVMRVASISKSLTMAVVGRLIEEEKLDLDRPITHYVSEFPQKTYGGRNVSITTRMLLSHMSGLRHYKKVPEQDQEQVTTIKEVKEEFDNPEYFSMKRYHSVTEALDMFKDDLLFHEPGKKFLYTTHGWTLVSAVAEKAAGEDFLPLMEKTFRQLGMDCTSAESATDIVYNRARHYVRDAKGRLVNVPYVDNSYKWSGGGFISNVPDLIKFSNIMLYSFQCPERSDSGENFETSHGFLKRSTVQEMWQPIASMKDEVGKICDEYYGMGWFVYPQLKKIGCGRERDFAVAHTGGAIGGSSILYIEPVNVETALKLPHGVVVAILANLQSVNLTELAREISGEFKYLVKEFS